VLEDQRQFPHVCQFQHTISCHRPRVRDSFPGLLFWLRPSGPWLTCLQAQTQLFYIGDEARLLGTNINDQSSPRIVEDSINSKLYVTGSESNLAAYWPWVIFQDSKGGLVHVRNNPPSAMTPASEWAWANINITALVGTKLAMVPVSTNYTRIASRGGYGVFYQGTDSRLAVAITHLSEMDSTYPLSWPTSAYGSAPVHAGS